MRPFVHPLRIGSLELANNLILAPMAGISDLPFRLMSRGYGCAYAVTELISAEGLTRGGKRTFNFLATLPQDAPLGVQIFGARPQSMGEAARVVTDMGADVVDINAGCPTRKITRNGAGCALMRTPELLARIITAVRKATPLPVTIKIRSGLDDDSRNFLEIGRLAADCGVDAVTIHPRTAREGYSGTADIEATAALKQHLGVPVIHSGDIVSGETARRVLEHTGADGLMIGRGAMGRPWLFSEILGGDGDALAGADAALETVLEHYRLMRLHYGGMRGTRIFRQHLACYVRARPGATEFRRRAMVMEEPREVIGAVTGFFRACALHTGPGGETSAP